MKSIIFATLLAVCTIQLASARENATSAIDVFLLSDCEACTKDKNSIFCSEADGGDTNNFVRNRTLKVTIADKKNGKANVIAALGPADGAKYCWSGTFGKLTNNKGNYSDLLGSDTIVVELDCADKNLFYRQCVIPAQMAIILMVVGSIVFTGGLTLCLFCCGCCKCCNEKGDTSKWGCCNRFCPWCTLCADKHLREKESSLELAEDRSLTGKSSKLNEAYGKSLTEKSTTGDGTITNPMLRRNV